MGLKDNVVIVTGASRGIGRALAVGFGREGAKVVVAARSETERGKLPGTIHAAAEEVAAAGAEVLAVRCDVRDEESVNAMVARTMERFGRVDALINNAAAASYKPFLELSVREWDLVISASLRGPFLCAKAVTPIMVRQGGGSIVNISSKAADHIISTTVDAGSTEPVLVGQAYGAAKAGLERFTWGLAAELGRYNIAVNAVKPQRAVLTEGLRLQRSGADLSTWVGPETMVKTVLFLAAQRASGVSGVVATDSELAFSHGL